MNVCVGWQVVFNHIVLVPSMSGNPNRFDGAGAEDRSDRTDLLRLLREDRTVIIQLVVLVQHIHRYREELVAEHARSVKRQRVEVSSGPSSAASSGPSSAASSGASGADFVDEQSLWDFFMNLPNDIVVTPPPVEPQLPHRMNEGVPQSEQRVARDAD